MIKLKIVTNSGVETDIVDENKTIREVLEEKEITYAGRTMTLDGYALSASELVNTLAEMCGGADRAVIGITAKTENAAKATVIGNAMVITSSLKLEDLETIMKYRPEALTLVKKDEDGEKDPVFRIGLTEDDAGTINKYGAVFSKTVDDEGKARLTMTFGPDYTKEDLLDDLGPAILKLNELEEILGEQLEGIAADKEAAKNAIDFA